MDPLHRMGTQDDLPNEILLKIFQQSLPFPLNEAGRRSFQYIRSVCPRWRLISFSSPVLWSSISAWQGFDVRFFPRLNKWFSRAGLAIPLELECLGLYSKDQEPMEALIGRFQSRWKYLNLCPYARCLWNCVLSLPSTNWINLQTLEIRTYFTDNLSQDIISARLDALSSILSLQRLVLQDYIDSSIAPKRTYGPTTLRELQLNFHGDIFTDIHVHLISGYTNLTALVLHEATSSRLQEPPGDLTLPFLLHLSYTGSDLTWLKYFTTPVLASLDIDLKPDDEERELEDAELLTPYDGFDVGDILGLFVGQCFATLHILKLNTNSDEWAIWGMKPYLCLNPNLSDLTLDTWELTTGSMLESGNSPWCPGLRCLTILQPPSGLRMKQMELVAACLRRRAELGAADLESLTIQRREERDPQPFPYHLFEDLPVRRFSVTVPW
jgi:F-box-like